MQQATAASFFPTAKELSSGVQWFKDHPVLAAAAATAVSVITYLNALELEAEVHQSEEPQPSIASSKHKRPLSSRRSKGSPSLVRKGSGASDGKLSAAVSWCDEHGGSLTQVFEDDTPTHRRGRRLEESDSDDETRDDVAESYQDAFQQHRALAKSVTMQQLDGGVATSDSEGDTSQTESPQWGWYVAITPPQDQFQATGRGSEMVTCSEQSKAGVNTIRRTTSGQIQ
ncbi:hypothetical protein DVH05_011274 [Phytophthora capsici]|nr:hypothetical protein DVH05_011274 [Phytophthora capsici]